MNHDALPTPFKTYIVYHSFEDNAADIQASIQKLAQDSDMEDQIVAVYQDNNQLVVYTNPAGRQAIVDGVEKVQALGHMGQLFRPTPKAPANTPNHQP